MVFVEKASPTPSLFNLFIYQARESSLVSAGFLTAQFLKKTVVYETCVVMGDKAWGFSLIACLDKRESV